MKYTAPLVDWIGYALNRENLDQTLSAIKSKKRIRHLPVNHQSNRRYLEKILREEVVKQFDNSFRPMLELVLNSLDAKPVGTSKYDVRVYTSRRKLTVIDDGSSLTLEQILRFLIVPFNTEKDGIEQIGRFGVGFLSNFFYCINDRNTDILVRTTTEKESYQLRFWCPTGIIEDLMLELKTRRKAKNNQTTVIIRDVKYPSGDFIRYLTLNLSDIPSYMARIYVDSCRVNEQAGDWYTVPVKLEIKGKQISQEVGLRRAPENAIRITSQGVKVKHVKLSFMPGAVISFPSAVKLVEGRDEFKIDENYSRCIEAAFSAFEKNLEALPVESRREKLVSDLFTSLVSALSAHDIGASIPNLDKIRKLMFGDAEYMLPFDIYYKIKDFLPEELRPRICGVSLPTLQLFSPFYPGYDELLIRYMGSPLSTSSFSASRKYLKSHAKSLPFVRLLLKNIDQTSLQEVKIIKMKPGRKPFYLEVGKRALWINCRHPSCRMSFDFVNLYSFLCEFSRESNLMKDISGCLAYHNSNDFFNAEIMVQKYFRDFVDKASDRELEKCTTS